MTEQRTDDWFNARRGKLTASNLGALLGLVKWTSRQLAYDRINGRETTGSFTNKACEWGTVHERDGVKRD